MVVDYERAWLEFKAAIVGKNSHGQRDLLAQMARIEVDCRVPEGERGFDPAPPIPLRRKSATAGPRAVPRND